MDYLADILGLSKNEVVSVVGRMRQEGILADSMDISAYLHDTGESENRSKLLLKRFTRLERYILDHIPDESLRISCKQLNDDAQKEGITKEEAIGNLNDEDDIPEMWQKMDVIGDYRMDFVL